jgi:flavin reductase (DIM6/NTAB) family NADH-FMN oxidoreductase RutF
MKRAYRKRSYPLDEIRRFLEPGPIVLVSSASKGSFNIMTMGWHMMLGFSPALFGCYIWEENHSYQMLRRSKECVINLPTLDLVDTVVGIGNCHGADVDKFQRFGLTPKRATKVAAPLIAECYANFECRLRDTRMIRTYGLFIWEVVKAHVALSPKRPQTIHYRGEGEFMISGPAINRRRKFRAGEPLTRAVAEIVRARASLVARSFTSERSTLENARRYDNGLVPTTVPKCSRITAADPKPASAATCSMARSVVSSNRCARRTRACESHAAGVAPTCSRKRRLSVLVLIAARRAMTGSGSSRERFCSNHVSNGVMAPGASDGGACSMNCACPPARSSGITASRATDAATSAPRS